ncbi:hypothetical protein Pcinc_014107 [Petrolisthes cinctipes]|uniref:Uncharacterized protein n=1 Tax=Petrolisthes cinctipes TaxID=88211 RepID=A0AAE1KPK1_PETCI|nr:hypothetical protein Pcinc_014107 [Petrolisthes cinctipes]
MSPESNLSELVFWAGVWENHVDTHSAKTCLPATTRPTLHHNTRKLRPPTRSIASPASTHHNTFTHVLYLLLLTVPAFSTISTAPAKTATMEEDRKSYKASTDSPLPPAGDEKVTGGDAGERERDTLLETLLPPTESINSAILAFLTHYQHFNGYIRYQFCHPILYNHKLPQAQTSFNFLVHGAPQITGRILQKATRGL